MAKNFNGPTLWLTNGSQTFEVPIGSPLEKRLRGQGYEDCDPPIPGAPGEADGSEFQPVPGADVAALNARIAELEAQVTAGSQTLGGGELASGAAPEPAPAEQPAPTEKAKAK